MRLFLILLVVYLITMVFAAGYFLGNKRGFTAGATAMAEYIMSQTEQEGVSL